MKEIRGKEKTAVVPQSGSITMLFRGKLQASFNFAKKKSLHTIFSNPTTICKLKVVHALPSLSL
jgi:hypothetical protein